MGCVGQWITNPKFHGNVLALQGLWVMVKQLLLKKVLLKQLEDLCIYSFGGTSDSSLFDGHSYTYEGSHWNRIIDILMSSKCMGPIIYFDELDKLSQTYKGQEIHCDASY